jgi:hypothetical protein
MPDKNPIVGTYKGVGIHDAQLSARIEGVVKPEIDRVHAMTDRSSLFDFAGDPMNSPEARLLAAARCETSWELAAEGREVRPDLDLVMLRALTAGLDSVGWRDPFAFGTLLDPRPAVKRGKALI